MDNKKVVKQQFGKSAESYVSSPIHKQGKDLQRMLEMAKITGEEELLDVATGGGHTANAFAPFVKKITAVDLTKEMLEAAKKFVQGNGYQNIDFIEADAEKMPFSDGTFDIVTCRIAPHHFPDISKFVDEVYRVLKPEGQFLLDDNVAPEDDELDQFYNTIEKRRDFSHFRAWKKTEWLRLLELSGFEIYEWARFEKTFQYDSWCDRMNVSPSDKENLTDYIHHATQKIKDKFRIVIENHHVISFLGEAIVLKAVKK